MPSDDARLLVDDIWVAQFVHALRVDDTLQLQTGPQVFPVFFLLVNRLWLLYFRPHAKEVHYVDFFRAFWLSLGEFLR